MVDGSDIALRWFNALPVEATENQISIVVQLPFVKEIIPLRQSIILTGKNRQKIRKN